MSKASQREVLCACSDSCAKDIEIERLRAELKEAEELLQTAFYAHQKMGLEGCGASGLSHEVRMFAQDFSIAETPKTPQHTILTGNGRYRKFLLRGRAVEQKDGQ